MISSKKKLLGAFLGYTPYVFVFTVLMSLALALFPQGPYQFMVVLGIGLGWVAIGSIYAFLETRRLWYENLPGLIKYHRIVKEIQIDNEDGDALMRFAYEGENLGNTPLKNIFHALPEYDSDRYLPSKAEGFIDVSWGEIPVKTMGKVVEGQQGMPNKFDSRFVFEFPNAIKPKSNLPIHGFQIRISKCFKKAFTSGDTTSHSVDVLTDNLSIRLITKHQIRITDRDFSVEDFHRNLDAREYDRVQRECPPSMHGNDTLVWEVDKPKLTYKYILKFKLTKVTRTTSA